MQSGHRSLRYDVGLLCLQQPSSTRAGKEEIVMADRFSSSSSPPPVNLTFLRHNQRHPKLPTTGGGSCCFSPHPFPTGCTTTAAAAAEPPPTPQNRLQCLLQSVTEWWAYAILWRPTSSPAAAGEVLDTTIASHRLSWGEGFFRGTGCSRSVPSLVDDEANSRISSEGGDVELFYIDSTTRSFVAGDHSLPICAQESAALVWLCGSHDLQVYGCNRSREACLHGVQSLAFIPTGEGGVVELGSSELVGESLATVQKARALFGSPDLLGWAAATAPTTIVTSTAPPLAALPDAELENKRKDTSSEVVDSERSDSESGVPTMERHRGKRKRAVTDGRPVPVDHVEAERQRREKLNHQFYTLRSVVPNVSRLDKASLLADAVAYIRELESKIKDLEAEGRKASTRTTTAEASCGGRSGPTTTETSGMEVDVRILGAEAIIRVQSEKQGWPSASVMGALRDLHVKVRHASISSVGEVMLQDVVAEPPPGLQNSDRLRAAVLAAVGR